VSGKLQAEIKRMSFGPSTVATIEKQNGYKAFIVPEKTSRLQAHTAAHWIKLARHAMLK